MIRSFISRSVTNLKMGEGKNSREGTIVLSTFPTEQSAADTAKSLINSRLCACVNFTTVRSIYTWHDKLEDQKEVIALFKTSRQSVSKFKEELARLHPYEVPEIVELGLKDVSKSYLAWLVESSTDRIAKKRHNASK